MVQILISGGSGLVGKALCEKLQIKGYAVAILSRSKKKDTRFKAYLWNPKKNQIDPEAIATSDYIIHLAGANIAEKKWSSARKKIIIDSRTQTADLIFGELKRQQKKIKAFISASGAGYYGAITSDKIFTEEDRCANDFLGQTCQEWEQAAKQFESLNIRTLILRTGIVLSKSDGALSKMIVPAKMGLASAIGTGEQYMPWIHIDDLCAIYIKAIEDNQMEGVFNAVAPYFETNISFTRSLAKVLNKPFFFPKIPSFLLRLILGEMSDLLLKGSRVSAKKILSKGYIFKYSELENALRNILK